MTQKFNPVRNKTPRASAGARAHRISNGVNPAQIKAIIGLGNPGRIYQNTYHNLGFLFIDYLKNRQLPGNRQLCKTDTHMNRSGEFVRKITKKNNLKSDEILIVHDDSDLEFGQFKLSFNRGSAGHKGVESVIKNLKTTNIWRLRIGVRKTKTVRAKASAFVLKPITAQDKKILAGVFLEITTTVLPR